MPYVEGFDRAHEFALSALQFMREAGISATPQNFAVWYDYASLQNDELRRTIDILIKNKRPITEDLTRQLHDEFIKNDPATDRVVDTTVSIEGTVDSVIATLESAGEDADAYGDALRTFSGNLASGSAGNANAVIARAINDTKQMQEQNAALLSQLARSTSTISKLREDLETVRHEALTDALTGIGNRKHFDANLDNMALQANESGGGFCLLLLDIDHFKGFNDTYGHQIGDQVLRLVAQALRENIGDDDFPARYGGEEFAVILPGKDLGTAFEIADGLRTTVAGRRVVRKRTGETVAAITISGGLASFRTGEALGDLVRRADRALYAAKKAGRNQIVDERNSEPARAAIA